MSKSISEEEVRHVAKLARLTLSDTELARMQKDLSNILGYVEKLEQLDTTNVAPTAHATALATLLRDDVVQPGLGAQEALKNAPERLGDGFGVPKIIE